MSDTGYPGPGFECVADDRDPPTRAELDTLHRLILAGLAEFGYPDVTDKYDEKLNNYIFIDEPSFEGLQRARALGYMKMGIPFTWRPVEAAGG